MGPHQSGFVGGEHYDLNCFATVTLQLWRMDWKVTKMKSDRTARYIAL